ncbi:hypothetical protein P0082_07575 [Candidatus Haliotispira prima]|uniref:RiboL-PSP-HEPN domain-containing protein n=1 Tax=Candidatus Haliotispira prima TaxID=3034016 RepID=A0ABY8MG82_9SPIO|nr:hypothetical protein P0082_07575 [Candidatus Haliotispira prima]
METSQENTNPVEGSIENYDELKEFLVKQKKFYYAAQLNHDFVKVLMISSFSYIEDQFQTMLKTWVERVTINQHLQEYVKNKILARGFYQSFDFKAESAGGFNPFLKAIGIEKEEIKSFAFKKKNYDWKDCAEAFISLGMKRNTMVHNNYLEQDLGEVTVEEITELFRDSMKVIEILRDYLNSV